MKNPLLTAINARLHLTESPTGVSAPKNYYDDKGWVGGEIPIPKEFAKPDGTLKDDHGQLDAVIGPQYDYPKGSFIRSTKQPAPGWADIKPEEVLSPEEMQRERQIAQKMHVPLTAARLREAARIKKILLAIKRHVYTIMRPLAARYPSYSIDDMAANGYHQLTKALRSRLDSAKPTNKFLTWASTHLEAGATHGTGGGTEHRAARGDLGRLLQARKPEQVDALLNKISPENRTGNDSTFRTDPESNPYGKYTPRIATMAQDLRNALSGESDLEPQDVYAQIEELLEEIRDDEEGTLGAKTGFMKGGISIPHSGDDQWHHFVDNVKVGSTHAKGAEGEEIEKSELATGRKGGYSGDDRANFTDVNWPDLNDAPPETAETFKAALDFSMQQYLTMIDEGEAAFQLTPGIKNRLHKELGVTMDSVPPLDLQQIRYVARKLGLKQYPTRGQTFDLEIDRKKYRDLVSKLTASGTPEAQAKQQATQQSASQWLQMGCPTMAAKLEQAAINRYKALGQGPEIPTLKDLAPAPVDPKTFEGAGRETPAKDLKRLEDSMQLFGVWYWLYASYELNESKLSVADRAIILESWNLIRGALLTQFRRDDIWEDTDYLPFVCLVLG